MAWSRHFLWKVGWVVPALVLVSACSSVAQTRTTSSASSIGDNGALPVESQLIAGSLLLEETDVPIDKDQAGELLLLWKAFRSLSNSDTSAPAEIDAVITQIQDAMTADQLEAIHAMQLSSDDLASVLQEHATQSLASSGSAGSTSFSTGLGPGGFDGGGGFGPGGGEGIALLAPSAGQGAILSAASTEVPSGNLTTGSQSGDRAVMRLVDSLITLLEAKADA